VDRGVLKANSTARRTKGEPDILLSVALRLCQVSFTDGRGVRHAVEVHATSVLEAAALGVKTIRDTGVLDDDGTFDIVVEIRTTTRHQVAWARVQDWLESSSRSPKEKLLKESLR
jgi:hypothetical protein